MATSITPSIQALSLADVAVSEGRPAETTGGRSSPRTTVLSSLHNDDYYFFHLFIYLNLNWSCISNPSLWITGTYPYSSLFSTIHESQLIFCKSSLFAFIYSFIQEPEVRCVLEDFKQCSKSHLWKLMMSFYDRKGPEAWSQGTVPHFITCNSFIGRSYAKVTRRK